MEREGRAEGGVQVIPADGLVREQFQIHEAAADPAADPFPRPRRGSAAAAAATADIVPDGRVLPGVAPETLDLAADEYGGRQDKEALGPFNAGRDAAPGHAAVRGKGYVDAVDGLGLIVLDRPIDAQGVADPEHLALGGRADRDLGVGRGSGGRLQEVMMLP